MISVASGNVSKGYDPQNNSELPHASRKLRGCKHVFIFYDGYVS